ncbi:hypothetical protein BDV95DRAFT_664938 [Massariosphaeria phaeospora]|uniref:Uncharacterized protein n=1 Tax=Massariosphaeria phaeospora TaxID=100035 RepID=A0A7C8IBD6_9PLEO|nr:hypothetical protein BDV95DRAFT_664938 [Massariosphaeria phaeospora]
MAKRRTKNRKYRRHTSAKPGCRSLTAGGRRRTPPQRDERSGASWKVARADTNMNTAGHAVAATATATDTAAPATPHPSSSSSVPPTGFMSSAFYQAMVGLIDVMSFTMDNVKYDLGNIVECGLEFLSRHKTSKVCDIIFFDYPLPSSSRGT